MQTLGQLIAKASGNKKVRVGRVEKIEKSGRYKVVIGGKTFTAESRDPLDVGARVVVSDTETGKYVIGSGGNLSRSPKEVIING